MLPSQFEPLNLTPSPPPIILHHGTTLLRARSIEANGPNPRFKEPGGMILAEGFSTEFTDGRSSWTGVAVEVARNKDSLFPNEGGPAILEIAVPPWIMDILFADPLMEAVSEGGEARFEKGFGLEELCAEWSNITKRVILL